MRDDDENTDLSYESMTLSRPLYATTAIYRFSIFRAIQESMNLAPFPYQTVHRRVSRRFNIGTFNPASLFRRLT